MLKSSQARFNSIIAVPVPLMDLNPCKTPCNYSLARRRVSISASTTFHRVSSRLMPRVLLFPFVVITRTHHTNSCGISPVIHMCCTMSTIHIQRSIRGEGVFNCSLGYSSLRHCLNCSAWRWLCLPSLCGIRRRTADSTDASYGISSFTLEESMCIARGSPGGCGSSL